MSDITWWFDFLKILIPAAAVIMAGFFALHRMKKNVKLEAKLKWKEEFRNRVVEFTNTSMTLNSEAIWTNIDSESKKVDSKEYIDLSHKLHTIYYAIEMMLDSKDLRTEVLNANYRTIINNAYNEAIGNGENKNIVNSTDDFYEIAKDIYDDNNYIDSLI